MMHLPALPSNITLVAVTKTFPAERVLEAVEAGVTHFGENRVEEAQEKIPRVKKRYPSAVFHMVGHVQSKKAKDVVELFDWVDSVDSVKIAEKFNQAAGEHGKKFDILLQVNMTGEKQKFGFALKGWEHDERIYTQFVRSLEIIRLLQHLRVRGTMTMPPLVADPEKNRPVFVQVKRLFDRIAKEHPHPDWQHISMGTSQDYQVAIEEGATMVRLGTALFGPRT